MAKLSTSNEALHAAIEAMNLGSPNNIRRVVIDLQAGHPPQIYVECYADPEGTIQVVKALTTLDVGMVIAHTDNLETTETKEDKPNG